MKWKYEYFLYKFSGKIGKYYFISINLKISDLFILNIDL